MGISKELKEAISQTVEATIEKVGSAAWLDRQRQLQDITFKNTERLLYSYNTLKEYTADEAAYIEDYMQELQKQTSKSIVKYTPGGKGDGPDEDLILQDRRESYARSLKDVQRIEKALHKIENKKGYEVIKLRYLSKDENGDTYTYEAIADILANSPGYNNNLNEKTVRLYKNILVKEMAVLLFGSDAI